MTYLKIDKSLGNLSTMVGTLNNISSIYLIQNKISKASSIIKEALKIAKELGDKKSIVNCQIRIGNILNSQRYYDDALEKYEIAFNIAKSSWCSLYRFSTASTSRE